MLRVGITGGIGSGKSTIAQAFQVLGAPLFKADEEAKRALNKDPELIRSVKASFGEDLYGPEGLDRKGLARIVFSDREKLEKLNQLVHPKVRERFEEWCEKKEAAYVVQEAAILIESGGYRNFDHLILVSAPQEQRIQRVAQRDGIAEANVRERMKEQWSDEEKAPYADTILANDDSELLLPRILDLDGIFREKEASTSPNP